MRRAVRRLGIAGLFAFGALGIGMKDAQADKRFTCQMTGSWVESNDDFKFSAVYIAKDGPDTFTGRYTNPGSSEADIIGNASSGTWMIILTYTDAGHKGMVKKLIGRGAKDPATHLLKIEGNYKTYIGANDIKKDGKFRLLGVCK